MTSIPIYLTKKNNYIVKSKKKQKPIPININTNPFPSKFLFSNHVNNIASSYLSIGIKNKNKNINPSKIVHINTKSANNNYTINSKDTKQTNNSSFTNSLINNHKTNNKSNLNSLNFININNINNTNNNSQQKNYDINKNNNDKKQIAHNNIIMSKGIFINLYENHKIKNNKTTINNISKIKQKCNNKHNILDSKNKGKKMTMKSKIYQYTFQYKKSKPSSASFNNNNNNLYLSKKYFQENLQRVLFNGISEEKHSKNANTNTNSNINNNDYSNKNIKNIINRELVYQLKNNHFRHNTGSFGNKRLINVFHKKTLSNKDFNNINSLNRNINNNKINNESKNNSNIRKKYKIMKKVQLDNIKISKDKLLSIKDIKYNNLNNNNNKNITHNNHINYCTKNSSNISINNNSNITHKNKNSLLNSNINIIGVKKCLIKSKENTQKNIKRIKIQNIKLIPKQNQNLKNKIIPSQRNIKINLAEFLYDAKKKVQKKNNEVDGNKSLSSKKESKEKNKTFSLPQIKFKCSNKLIKTKEEKIINNNKENTKKNSKNKEIIEDKVKDKKKDKKFIRNNLKQYINSSKDLNIENNEKKDININKKDLDDKTEDLPNDFIYNHLFNLDLNINKCKNDSKDDYNIENNYININNIINPENKNIIEENKQQKEKDININQNNKKNDNIQKNNIDDAYEVDDYEKENIKVDNELFNNNNIKFKSNNKYCKISDDKKKKFLQNYFEKDFKKLINNNIIANTLFDKDNLDELPKDYDEKFNDLFSIINKINFGKILLCSEGIFTPEGKIYTKYKDKFDKYYDNKFMKKANSYLNSSNKPKKIMQMGTLTSNAKTNFSSSKKNLINDLNVVKEFNVYS